MPKRDECSKREGMTNFFEGSEYFDDGGYKGEDPTRHQRRLLMKELFPEEKGLFSIKFLSPKGNQELLADITGFTKSFASEELGIKSEEVLYISIFPVDKSNSIDESKEMHITLGRNGKVMDYYIETYRLTRPGEWSCEDDDCNRIIPSENGGAIQEKARTNVTGFLRAMKDRSLDLGSLGDFKNRWC